jgi:Ca2+-binding RTX toxin-like protein
VISERGFSLGANIDNLIIVGTRNFSGSGNVLDNYMRGGSGNNTLIGRAGNDILDGGEGADKMYGGEGDDTYYVDQSNDIVFEGQAGWGPDQVYATATFTLGNNIDNITLLGSADIDATGNNDANVITGNDGDNVLRGRGGDDRFVFLTGGGDDTILDFFAGGAEDEIDLSCFAGSGVSREISQVGADTLFAFSDGGSLTRINVDMTSSMTACWAIRKNRKGGPQAALLSSHLKPFSARGAGQRPRARSRPLRGWRRAIAARAGRRARR